MLLIGVRSPFCVYEAPSEVQRGVDIMGGIMGGCPLGPQDVWLVSFFSVFGLPFLGVLEMARQGSMPILVALKTSCLDLCLTTKPLFEGVSFGGRVLWNHPGMGRLMPAGWQALLINPSPPLRNNLNAFHGASCNGKVHPTSSKFLVVVEFLLQLFLAQLLPLQPCASPHSKVV